jgi:hypothetical protein
MTGLTEFLAARLDEDEARAQAMEHDAYPPDDEYYWCPAALAKPLADDLPFGEKDCQCGVAERKARALRDVAAKRVILAEHEAVLGECHTMELKADRRPRKYGEYDGLHKAVVELAAIDRDHPDYDQEWAL